MSGVPGFVRDNGDGTITTNTFLVQMRAIPRCVCHDQPLLPSEFAWLKEDDTLLCEDGHMDELHDDPFDYYDHGTRYKVSDLTSVLD